MPENGTSDLTRQLLAGGGLAALVSILLGYLKFFRQGKAEVAHINAQADHERASADEKRANTERVKEQTALETLKESLAQLRLDVARFRDERDEALRHAGAAEVAKEGAESRLREAEARLKLYEDQMPKVKAVLDRHGLEFPS
jgi:hypothetical protein